MSNKLTYKGYSGSTEISFEDDCLFGKIQDINDIITYEGNTVSELANAFKVAVDDYLEFCSENDKEADRPYSGSFNVRIDKELHKQVAVAARDKNMSLNSLIGEVLQSYLKESEKKVESIKQGQNPLWDSLFHTGAGPLDYLLTAASTQKISGVTDERKH